MKIIKKAALFTLLMFFLLYVGLFLHNNYLAGEPSREEIEQSLDRAIGWLESNRESVLKQKNMPLWWMIRDGALISGDVRLRKLYSDFLRDSPEASRGMWSGWLKPGATAGQNWGAERVAGLQPYQQYFGYALSCSPTLEAMPAVQAQHDPGYCYRNNPLGHACVTHQLMAFMLMRDTACQSAPWLDARQARLHTLIERQLRFDPFFKDAYIQRLLMLSVTGANDAIRQQWLARLVTNQLGDGGWLNGQVLLSLGGGHGLILGSKSIGVQATTGKFHATAQAVLFLSQTLTGSETVSGIGGPAGPDGQNGL